MAALAMAVLGGVIGVGGLDELALGSGGPTQLVLGRPGPGLNAIGAASGGAASGESGGSAPRVGLIDSVTSGSGTAGPEVLRAGAEGLGAGRSGTGEAAAALAPGVRPPCEVVPAPRSLGLSSYYEKLCLVQGVPVVASAAVADPALVAAARVVAGMLRHRPDLIEELVARRFRLGIIGVGQRAIELPEYRDLPVSYPHTNWDAARAYGATPSRPLAAVPEENLLCSAEDTYPGQSVLAHELGHSVLDMAVLPNNPAFEDRLRVAFRAAADNPSYRNTYAMTNVDEYWGEGVQDFFDASREAHGPNGGGDGYDGPIFSRDTLRDQDPALHALIAEVFTEVPWRPVCP